ncbi:MAG: hypothetical protein C5B52_11575 [Bacteroidetes bacterium]|nr:MAG: hypothetical protein C5B52_11575 [Bacteroidota bacterium]
MVVVYFILALILTVFVVALVAPSHYLIERSIIVNQSSEKIFAVLSDLNTQIKWNPWMLMEPDANFVISGEPGSIGHNLRWQGKKIGTGILTLANRTINQSLHFQTQFLKPWKSKADNSWTLFQTGSTTLVTWRNKGDLPFPVARLMAPIFKKQLNHHFEKGLVNFKIICEALD